MRRSIFGAIEEIFLSFFLFREIRGFQYECARVMSWIVVLKNDVDGTV